MAGAGPHTSRSSLFRQQRDRYSNEAGLQYGCCGDKWHIPARRMATDRDHSTFLALGLMVNSWFDPRNFFPLWEISFWSGKYWKHPSPVISQQLESEAVFLHYRGTICRIKFWRMMVFVMYRLVFPPLFRTSAPRPISAPHRPVCRSDCTTALKNNGWLSLHNNVWCCKQWLHYCSSQRQLIALCEACALLHPAGYGDRQTDNKIGK